MDLLISKIVKINYRNKKYMLSKYDICYYIDKNVVCFFFDNFFENKYIVLVFFFIYEINY